MIEHQLSSQARTAPDLWQDKVGSRNEPKVPIAVGYLPSHVNVVLHCSSFEMLHIPYIDTLAYNCLEYYQTCC